MKKIILILFSFLLINTVYAYENEYFSFDIDESYKEQTIEDKKYIFSKDNEYYSITIEDNLNNYDVSKFTLQDIKDQKEYLENEYKEEFKDYTNTVEITNLEVKSNNTIGYLEYDIYYETKSSIGYNIYQRCRMYTTDNYVYLILYNNDKVIENNDIMDTFKIKDTYLRKINVILYAILLVIMLAIIILLDYSFHKKRHK